MWVRTDKGGGFEAIGQGNNRLRGQLRANVFSEQPLRLETIAKNVSCICALFLKVKFNFHLFGN